MSSLVPFLGLAIVLVAIPGPAVTLIMKNAVMRGGRAAFVTALGVLVADMVWVVASVVGLTALLVASEPAFLAVKLFGAVYLIWLGALLLIGRHEQASPTVTPAGGVAPRGTGRAFREGVICDLSNPKTLLVFTSVIPSSCRRATTSGRLRSSAWPSRWSGSPRSPSTRSPSRGRGARSFGRG